MALTDSGNPSSMVMPVAPMGYGNGYGGMGNGFGFGGDWAWILLLLILGGNGWGGFGGWGAGGMMAPWMMGMGMGGLGIDYLYPWLNNSEHISDGFRGQQLSGQVQSINDRVVSGFGDVQLGISGVDKSICQAGNAVTAAVNNGFNAAEIAASGRHNALTQQLYTNQISDLERSYAAQTANTAGLTNLSSQLANCCCENRLATADLKYTEATEACATRNANAQNTRDIIDAQTRGTQAILDKLCALELDTVKSQLAQAQRENAALQNAVNMATMQASQVAQTAELRAAQATTANQLVNELRSCPIPSQPVYGNQPIFTCGGNNAAGCGCNGGFVG